MTYITVKNPESVDVKTNYMGTWYELPAGKDDSFPEDVAHRLKEVYGFLVLGGSKTRDYPVEAPTEEVEEEEVEEEVMEEDEVKEVVEVKAKPKKK